MKSLVLAFVVFLASASAAPTKLFRIIGAPRAKVIEILGKPAISKANGKRGLQDVYKVPGFFNVRAAYLGQAPKLAPFTTRFEFIGSVTVQAALAATGIDSKGSTTRKSPSDGSLLIENLRQLPKGWSGSFWTENNPGRKSHLDFGQHI